MATNITKQEIRDALVAISNSARVLGNEGLFVDLTDLIERIEKDL
jgi:hypothetical protein